MLPNGGNTHSEITSWTTSESIAGKWRLEATARGFCVLRMPTAPTISGLPVATSSGLNLFPLRRMADAPHFEEYWFAKASSGRAVIDFSPRNRSDEWQIDGVEHLGERGVVHIAAREEQFVA